MENSKRKKNSSSGMKGIPQEIMDFIIKSSIYDKLEHIAMKKKLTEVHVQNIIRKVIYGISPNNPCDYSLNESDEETSDQEPKLTRAKRKELDQRNQNVRFLNFPKVLQTPISASDTKSGPNSMTHETKSFVTAEFPEDDDDEEYNPELDEQILSDEESILSLLGSPCSTATPRGSASIDLHTPSRSQNLMSPPCSLNEPSRSERAVQRSLNFSREQTSLICERTRSKYPMTDTPLEYIEMSFNPPDITPDMYNTEIENDDYKEFILDYVQGGVAATSQPDEDEQGDPEYDLWADADGETPSLDEIREELRGDKGVRISKKEVNDLMLESYELCLENDCFAPQQQQPPLQWINTAEAVEVDTSVLQEEQVNNSDPIVVTYMLDEFSKEQVEVLQSQLMAHVQLLTQSVLMSSYDVRIQYVEEGCKKMINEIAAAGDENSKFSQTSLFHTCNLEAAQEAVSKYDSKREEYLKSQKGQTDKRVSCRCFKFYLRPFPDIFDEIFLDSLAFPYVQFLPYGVFWICYHGTKKGFLKSEYYLMASGLSEIVSDRKFFEINEDMRYRKCFHKDMNKAIDSLIKLYGISSTVKSLSVHLRRLLLRNHNKEEFEDNPFVKFAKTGVVDLPKASKIELHGTKIPLPIKDITPKFLPKYYNKMIKKHSGSKRKKKTKRNSLSKSPTRKKIILLQDGEMTKIVLPANHAVVIEDHTQTGQKKYIPSSTNESNHCVSDFDAGSQTDLSLSSKPRPVNMVVPTPVPNTTCPTNLSNSLSDLPLNSEIDTNHNTSLTNNNNNNNPMTSVGSNSLSKYIMNFSISPLKTSFESVSSRSEHQQSQQNISKFSNNSVLENEPFNTNVENQSTCSDYQQVQLYPSSVSASPAQCDMPFLMATPTKNSNTSAVSSQPCVLSGTNFPASHLESNTNQRPSSTFSKTVVRDLFSPKTTSPLNTDADTRYVENNIEVSQESMSINTTNKNNSGTQEAHEPISSINMPDNEPDKNIDTNDITTSSLINTDTDKCFENEIESNIDKSRDDMASGKDEEQNDLSFEMNYFDKVKHILGGSFNKFMDLFSLFVHGKKTPKFIYPKICKMIKDHPDLQNEFLVFFNAEQAKKLGKESEHRIVLCAKHLYENKRSPELIDKEEVIQVLKSVMNHPNISESQLAYLLKPIITLQSNILENLT